MDHPVSLSLPYPIIYLFTIIESNTRLWSIFIDRFKARVYMKAYMERGSEEDIGKKGKKKISRL